MSERMTELFEENLEEKMDYETQNIDMDEAVDRILTAKGIESETARELEKAQISDKEQYVIEHIDLLENVRQKDDALYLQNLEKKAKEIHKMVDELFDIGKVEAHYSTFESFAVKTSGLLGNSLQDLVKQSIEPKVKGRMVAAKFQVLAGKIYNYRSRIGNAEERERYYSGKIDETVQAMYAARKDLVHNKDLLDAALAAYAKLNNGHSPMEPTGQMHAEGIDDKVQAGQRENVVNLAHVQEKKRLQNDIKRYQNNVKRYGDLIVRNKSGLYRKMVGLAVTTESKDELEYCLMRTENFYDALKDAKTDSDAIGAPIEISDGRLFVNVISQQEKYLDEMDKQNLMWLDDMKSRRKSKPLASRKALEQLENHFRDQDIDTEQIYKEALSTMEQVGRMF